MTYFSKREKIFVGVGILLLIITATLGLILVDRSKKTEDVAWELSQEIKKFEKEFARINSELNQMEGSSEQAIELRRIYEEKLKELNSALEKYQKNLAQVKDK